jgi:hypothetical protein
MRSDYESLSAGEVARTGASYKVSGQICLILNGSPLAPLGENAAVSGDCLTPRSARGEPGSQDGRPLRGQPLTAALGIGEGAHGHRATSND